MPAQERQSIDGKNKRVKTKQLIVFASKFYMLSRKGKKINNQERARENHNLPPRDNLDCKRWEILIKESLDSKLVSVVLKPDSWF